MQPNFWWGTQKKISWLTSVEQTQKVCVCGDLKEGEEGVCSVHFPWSKLFNYSFPVLRMRIQLSTISIFVVGWLTFCVFSFILFRIPKSSLCESFSLLNKKIFKKVLEKKFAFSLWCLKKESFEEAFWANKLFITCWESIELARGKLKINLAN